MKLDVEFPELISLVRRMGARTISIDLPSDQLDPRARLRTELETGKEISLSDIQIGPGGLLSYEQEQVVLYIKDTNSSLYELQNLPEKSRRFHISDCATLQMMRAESRFERYVVTRNREGLFKCDWRDPDTNETGEIDARLKVCKNCLKKMNWRDYDIRGIAKEAVWKEFELSDFLLEYATFFVDLPKRHADETGLDTYAANWSSLSLQTRKAANFECGNCGVRIPNPRNAMHVHHKNRIRSDNRPRNLQVLCALCHRSEPGHSHLPVSKELEATIRKWRVKQGIL